MKWEYAEIQREFDLLWSAYAIPGLVGRVFEVFCDSPLNHSQSLPPSHSLPPRTFQIMSIFQSQANFDLSLRGLGELFGCKRLQMVGSTPGLILFIQIDHPQLRVLFLNQSASDKCGGAFGREEKGGSSGFLLVGLGQLQPVFDQFCTPSQQPVQNA